MEQSDSEGSADGHRTLFIDADGFSNIDLSLRMAGRHNVKVVVVGNTTQNLNRFDGRDGVAVTEVAEEADEADFAIITAIRQGDILLTNDTGLAAVALAKGAKVMDGRGNRFDDETIDYRLHKRHESRQRRRSGERGRGPRKLTAEDVRKFEDNLKLLLGEKR